MRRQETRRIHGLRSHSRISILVLAFALVVAACTGSAGETTTTQGGDSDTTVSGGSDTTAGGGSDTTAGGGSDTTAAGGGGEVSSAEAAVQAAAEQCSGITLDVTWEAGPQAVEPIEFSGPMWTELTGVEINVIEMDVPDLFSTVVADHQAGGSSFDVVQLTPNNLPDLTAGGIIDPVNDYIAQYMNPADLDDYHPLYKNITDYDGQTWGLWDDGDIFLLYYRTDLFEDPDLQAAFEASAGRALTVPATWDELAEVAQFFTDELAPEIQGWGIWRNSFNDAMFMPAFQANGGQFFDVDNEMRALINSEAGVETVNQMLAQNEAGPDEMLSWGIFEPLVAYMAGELAMTVFWPPLGRWAEVQPDDPRMEFVPQSEVTGITGYAPLPGGHSQHSGGTFLGVSADSDAKECAYLFTQWMTSPEISVQRVQLDTSLRDPYRLSHFEDETYRNMWPTAGEYLDTIDAAGNDALIDLFIPGSFEYSAALDQGLTSIWAGEDVQTGLDSIASEWDRITDQIGVDEARAAWEIFLLIPGSSVETTVSELGLD
jgi:multiple sugar transport system substrate-binding protein